MIKVGIIGAGRIGHVHSESITKYVKGAKIKAISDVRVTDELKQWAKDMGIPHVYEDYKQMLQDPEIDAVLVCSSTNTHAPISIEAARAGKHIFCEKPVDADVNRIKEVLAEVEKAGVKFQVGFNRRFDHKLANGAIGVIDNSRKAVYGYDQRAEVFGSKGAVQTRNDTDSTAVYSCEAGVIAEKPKYFFLERYMQSFADEMACFVDSVVNDKPTLVNGNDGLQPVIIALAAKRSLDEGRPVKLAEIA